MSQSITSGDVEGLVPYLRRWRALDLLRASTFVAAFLLVWISLKPFGDLSDLRIGDFASGNEGTTYAAFALLAMVTAIFAMRDDKPALASLLMPAFILVACWILFSVLISVEPATSIRRVALTTFVIVLAATVVLLPKSPSEFARWLSVAALALLLISYLGILLAPRLSVHLATDFAEPSLAGDWRGPFGHKNIAAGVMVTLLFFAIYIFQSGAWLSGIAIFGMAFVFLLNAAGKSSLTLCLVVLLVTSMTSIVRSLWLRALITFAPLVMLNALSVGTVIFKDLAVIAKFLPLDSSFTGRTDIWTFAVQAAQERLATGYGFAAFWGSSAIQNLPEGKEWAAFASHSHNGYLEIALTLGLPGLALLIWAFVIWPIRNFHAADRAGNNGLLAMAFLRVWLFGIYLSCFESFFLERADPLWFTFLIAVFGLHYLARFRTNN